MSLCLPCIPHPHGGKVGGDQELNLTMATQSHPQALGPHINRHLGRRHPATAWEPKHPGCDTSWVTLSCTRFVKGTCRPAGFCRLVQ